MRASLDAFDSHPPQMEGEEGETAPAKIPPDAGST